MSASDNDGDEDDDASDGNGNHMKIQELDGACCENVQEILGMALRKPRFRHSADQFGLVGKMESGPLEARNWPYLDLHHRQRDRQARRYPLRTSKMKIVNKL